MVPWQRLAQAEVLGEKVPLVLSRREAEFAIRIGSRTLMGSRAHGSERLRVATEVLEGIIAAGCSPD